MSLIHIHDTTTGQDIVNLDDFVYCNRMAWLTNTVFVRLLPQVLCAITCNTIPSPLCVPAPYFRRTIHFAPLNHTHYPTLVLQSLPRTLTPLFFQSSSVSVHWHSWCHQTCRKPCQHHVTVYIYKFIYLQNGASYPRKLQACIYRCELPWKRNCQ